VTSDVARDLLASANNFTSVERAVWEYVSNSLDYAEEDIPVRVNVSVSRKGKSIVIEDNARGMSLADLEVFFRMHAENVDRKRGRRVRGKWGTGKSAAFGIGNVLRVDTRRNGRRNVVELRRDDLMAGQNEIPLRHIVRDEEVGFPNGTTIFIEEIFARMSVPAIVDYIELHLQAYRDRGAEVAVGNHVCRYREPEVSEVYLFSPDARQAAILGDVDLTVKVARAPLPETMQGIAITAGSGNLIAIETAGVEAKELGSYLFGSIDVPALEDSDSKIEPTDSSRSLRLNREHPVARVLIAFLGAKLEEARKAELEKKRVAERGEEKRRLAAQARKIEEIINQDFEKVQDRLSEIRSAAARPGKLGSLHGSGSEAGEDEDTWVEGTAVPGTLLDVTQNRDREGKGTGRPDPLVKHEGQPEKAGAYTVDPVGGTGARRRRPGSSFRVRLDELGDAERRSDFDRSSLEILINLEHPAVQNAYRKAGRNPDDPDFVRLCREIAFTEYALCYGNFFVERDPEYPGDDLLSIVKDRLDQVTRLAAPMYR